MDYNIRISLDNNVLEKSTIGANNNAPATNLTTKNLLNFEVGKYVGKQLLTSISSRVGTLTGNNVVQANVNGALKVAGYAAAVAVNPVLGTIGIMFDMSSMAFDRQWQQMWANRAASEQRRRSGNYLTDRNR